MSIKPTIIGAFSASAGDKPSAGVDNGGATQALTAMTSTIRPTAFKPTVMPGSPAASEQAPTTSSTSMSAARIQPTGPSVRQPVQASVLPGVQRKPLDVPLGELLARFPLADVGLLERVQEILAGIMAHSMSATVALAFGKPEQESLSSLVKDRLSLMEAAASRSVAQHLARMQTLLREVLEAMDGGFFRKPAATVWAGVSSEVQQLEGLLSNAEPALSRLQGSLAELSAKASGAEQTLHATSLAAEYLSGVASADVSPLLVSRATSLVTSQALAREQVQMLAVDTTKVQELTTLVQDGVLVQLPAVYSQLAGLSTKPSDTQRYLATEKLNEIVTIMQRKL
jgi:hypothetical protein